MNYIYIPATNPLSEQFETIAASLDVHYPTPEVVLKT